MKSQSSQLKLCPCSTYSWQRIIFSFCLWKDSRGGLQPIQVRTVRVGNYPGLVWQSFRVIVCHIRYYLLFVNIEGRQCYLSYCWCIIRIGRLVCLKYLFVHERRLHGWFGEDGEVLRMIKLVGGSVSAAGYVQMIKGASADGGPDIIQLQQCPYCVRTSIKMVYKWSDF